MHPKDIIKAVAAAQRARGKALVERAREIANAKHIPIAQAQLAAARERAATAPAKVTPQSVARAIANAKGIPIEQARAEAERRMAGWT